MCFSCLMSWSSGRSAARRLPPSLGRRRRDLDRLPSGKLTYLPIGQTGNWKQTLKIPDAGKNSGGRRSGAAVRTGIVLVEAPVCCN